MAKNQITIDTSHLSRYSNERVIGFSSPVGGGLIAFYITPDNQLKVEVYRQDLTVQVSVGEPGQPVAYGNLRLDAALYQAAKRYVASYEAQHQDAQASESQPEPGDAGPGLYTYRKN